MKTPDHLRWEDIIFENRNKEYGAYPLRVNYDARLSRSFMITFFAIASVIVFNYVLNFNNPHLGKIPLHDDILVMGNYVIEPNQPTIEVEPKAGQKPITTISKPETTSHTTDEHAFKPVTDVIDPTAVASATPTAGPEEGVALGGTAVSTSSGITDIPDATPKVLGIASVDVAPAFPGGIEKFYSFLVNNIKYSEEAKMRGISCRVFVEFIISKDGTLKDIKFKNPVEAGLDKSILNALAKCPLWKPGMSKGNAVNTMITVPVKFELK